MIRIIRSNVRRHARMRTHASLCPTKVLRKKFPTHSIGTITLAQFVKILGGGAQDRREAVGVLHIYLAFLIAQHAPEIQVLFSL